MNVIKNSQDTAYLIFLCSKSFKEKVPAGKEIEYKERIKKEIEIFKLKGLSSYMLIVADYVNEAKKRGIPVGPGRGSVGGSLVAHLIGIHEADPIKYGLIFERFYNADKVGLSDIDCDFSQKGKPEIEQYIIQKYGPEMCAQISNYAQLTPKPYARRIAGAYLYGGDHKSAVAVGNAIAESIPKDIHSVTQALKDAPLFAEYAKTEKYKHLGLLAEHLGNKNYNLSVHAGALVIGKRPLANIVPIRISKDGVVATEYEKERAEANGLAKMDILGLSTLDIIQDTYELIKKRGKKLPALPWNYDDNDKATYDLISKGNTLCVFQFGKSAGTIELCKKIHPHNIEELAMINALTRPGVPKEAREEFIQAKNSGKKVELLHPSLERAFAPTYGVAVFEECLMFLAQDVAGWDFNQADKLRKFVKDKGKDPDKGKKLRSEFVDFAVKVKNLPQEMAERIWDEIVANFASYAFNKSHAILYSFIAYQTAFLKAHYPLEFLTANLIFESNSNALDSEETILAIKGEIRNLNLTYFDQASKTTKIGKVKIVPPSINKSEQTYTIIDERTLLTGFDSLKYMGKDGIPEILTQRPFSNLSDFLMKVDGRKVRSPAVQALAASGSLDEFGMTRQLIYLYARDYKQKHSLWQKRKNKTDEFNYPWPELKEWTSSEKYAMEVKYIGEGLENNWREIYPGFFDSSVANFQKLAKKYPESEENDRLNIPYTDGAIQGIVRNYFQFKVKDENSKNFGKPMGKCLLEDLYGNTVSITIFATKLQELEKRLKELTRGKYKFEPGCVISIGAQVSWYQGEFGLTFQDLKKIAPSPALPKDLEPKKVKLKVGGRKKKENPDKDDILSEIEDELLEEGVSLGEEEIADEESEKFTWVDIEEERNLPDGFT